MKTVHNDVEAKVNNWLDNPMQEVESHVVTITHEYLSDPETQEVHIRTNLANESLHLLSTFIQHKAAEMSRDDDYDMECEELVDIMIPFIQSEGYDVEIVARQESSHKLDMLEDWEYVNDDIMNIEKFLESELLEKFIDELLFMQEGY